MSDQSPPSPGGGPWGPPRWRRRSWRRGPPPWWPQGEAWPPAGRQAWPRIGRRFLWRVAWFMALAFLLIGVVLTAGVLLVGAAVGLVPSPPAARILSLVVLIGLAFTVMRAGRRFGRMALDVGELIDAAGRIEAGELGVQVAERGPREFRTLARSFNAMSAQLATTDQNRRTFVADLAHEFRTPLAVIRGQAEGIEDGLYPADQAHVAPILDATQSLETLVEALRTMTLADVGGLPLHREAVEVGVLVNSTLAAFQSMADAAGVTLSAQIAPDVPPIDADPARIRGVLMNLLSNAIRYTPTGGSVSVGAERNDGSVTIRVRDTGPGIPEDLRAHVFERFVKGPGSPGAGLGLAIAKDVITAHGGSIDLVSEMGKGTDVRMTLPIAH